MSRRGDDARDKRARELRKRICAPTKRTRDRSEYPIRELPACVRNRAPGQVLNNDECLEVLHWFQGVLDDAAVAGGLSWRSCAQ